jgi:hypothetical protein
MRKQLGKGLMLLLITMLLMSVLPAYAGTPSEPHNANAMWIEPSSVSLTTADPSHDIGYTFNITVNVNMTAATKVGAWQVKVLFDNTQLEALACGYTAGAKSQFFENYGTVPASPTIDNGAGYVLHGESLLGAEENETAAADLCYITFNVTALPVKPDPLTSDFDITTTWASEDTFVLDETLSDCLDAVYDGSYSFAWEAPPNPNIAVDPTLVEYGPYPPAAIGEAFDVDIYIMGLSAAWDLTNATIVLCFNTTVIDVIGGSANVTIDGLWGGSSSATVNHPQTPYDNVTIFVEVPSSTPSGDVLVATVKFTVMMQQDSPPAPFGTFDYSPLAICYSELWNHVMEISTGAPDEGDVKIYALQALASPWLEVDAPGFSPDVVLGPAPAVGTEFDVNVNVANLSEFWFMVGYQFRLTYDPTLIEVVNVTEGPFLQNAIWNFDGTFFISFVEPPAHPLGPHVVIGGFLLPNMTSGDYDQTEFPHTNSIDPTLATVTFKALVQDVGCPPDDYACNLDIIGFWTDDEHFIDKDGFYIPTNTAEIVNGTYTMLGSYAVGRVIDVYTQYPAPYGGQGLNMPSDMFWPQKEVILCANVTYNCWPVQQKLVTFVVWDPQNNIWTVLEGVTNEDGVACVSFRIPWPCDDPELLFGVWRIRADVDIACEVVEDWVEFHFDYLVNIVDVTTDKYYYEHCEYVDITITFTSHAQQTYDIALWTTIHDELNVPIATGEILTTVGGAEYCTPNEYEEGLSLHILKFAFAGEATIHVVPRFEYLPGVWTAAGPEATTTIYILPS